MEKRMVARNEKTIADIEKQIERIASRCCDCDRLLRVFKSLPKPPSVYKSDIEVKIFNVVRAPLIRALGDLGCEESAPVVFDYVQQTRLRTEIIEGIRCLGKLGYTPSIPFIYEKTKDAERWYVRYKNYCYVGGVELVVEQIRVSRGVLERLEGLRDNLIGVARV